jgi:hypothetical protein
MKKSGSSIFVRIILSRLRKKDFQGDCFRTRKRPLTFVRFEFSKDAAARAPLLRASGGASGALQTPRKAAADASTPRPRSGSKEIDTATTIH